MKILLILFLIICSFSSFASENSSSYKGWYVGHSQGLTLVKSDTTKVIRNNNYIHSFDLQLSYYLNNWFALEISALKATNLEKSNELISESEITSAIISSVFRYELSKYFSFYFKAGIGNTNYSERTKKSFSTSDNISTNGFFWEGKVYQVGIGSMYRIAENWHVKFTVDRTYVKLDESNSIDGDLTGISMQLNQVSTSIIYGDFGGGKIGQKVFAGILGLFPGLYIGGEYLARLVGCGLSNDNIDDKAGCYQAIILAGIIGGTIGVGTALYINANLNERSVGLSYVY